MPAGAARPPATSSSAAGRRGGARGFAGEAAAYGEAGLPSAAALERADEGRPRAGEPADGREGRAADEAGGNAPSLDSLERMRGGEGCEKGREALEGTRLEGERVLEQQPWLTRRVRGSAITDGSHPFPVSL
mmetsp:Transcript_24688/g.75272  ORF Transcript_24688/g.75272 Transcript_24688/m.75272 type:complete len:132 (+) Transcript_24688:1339-1734(+)|eukprot:scaffold69116_cov32-Tisochrysis_lutea.AAC.5